MSNFTRTVTKQLEFDGDSISVVFNRMKTSDFKLLAKFIEIGPDGKPMNKASFSDQIEMLSVAEEILPKRIESLEGLVDEEGTPLTVEDIVKEQYFIDLVSELFGIIMESSTVSDSKKSVGKSVGASKESVAH